MSEGTLAALLPRRYEREQVAFAGAVVVACAVAAMALAADHQTVAVVASVVPIAAWCATRPTAPLVLFGLSIPAVMSLTNNSLGSTGNGGYNTSVSDFLLLLIVVGIVFRWMSGRSEPVLRSLRPVALPVLPYCGVMLILLAVHPGIREVFKTGQRFELFLLPLIVGAFAALTGRHIRVLQAYVVATTILAVVWPVHDFGLNKNPMGQMIANAILLLVGVRALRRLWPCLVPLAAGLIFTVSRGAIVGTVIGIMVILVLQRTRARPVMTRVLPFALVALSAFAVAPPAVQSRVTTFHAGTGTTPGEYAIYLRQKYAKDAQQIIRAHPWTGVGIGNYYAADSAVAATPVLDPHQVLLQQEAEGGYIFGAAFVVLVGGAMLALRRMRQVDVAAAAAGVLIATVAHGLVDIYWVRGTPVLGWLLVGMACGGLVKLRSAELARRA
jgi:O-antigen ligase